MKNRKMINRKCDQYDINMAHGVARIVYERLREQLEREGSAEGLAHYEELNKKYNGDKQIEHYLNFLHKGSYVKTNEQKDNPQV